MKTHPRNAFGVSPSRGRHQRPGKAGSAVAPALTVRFCASVVTRNAVEN
jgi:hypothetical protein